MHTIWVDTPGGSEIFSYPEAAQPQLKDGEVLVKLSAIGVNLLDVYYRSALYVTSYPLIPGMEAAEEVEAMGAGVTDLKRGDREVYAPSHPGSDAEYSGVPASIVVPVPDDIEDRSAATEFCS
jgi:NADPH:quinone reductase